MMRWERGSNSRSPPRRRSVHPGDPGVSTGSSLVLTYTNGCRHFICHQTNNYTFSFPDIDLAILNGGGHLLRADVWFSESMSQDGNARLLQAARDRGLATSLDLNWDPFWGFCARRTSPGAKRRGAAGAAVGRFGARQCPRAEYLRRLDRSRNHARTAHRLGRRRRGLHLGARGAGYYCGGEMTVPPSVPVERHTHATGSGDLLSVCMMLLQERAEIPIAEKLDLANRIVAEYIEGRRDFLSTI